MRPGPRTARTKSSAVVVFVTARSEDEAAHIGRTVVEERLAACANILAPLRSLYWWEGKIADDQEVLLVLKTRRSLVPALDQEVRRLHSYSVPEVIALPIVGGSKSYLKWIEGETRKPLKTRRQPKTI